jgi:hypothetical protein
VALAVGLHEVRPHQPQGGDQLAQAAAGAQLGVLLARVQIVVQPEVPFRSVPVPARPSHGSPSGCRAGVVGRGAGACQECGVRSEGGDTGGACGRVCGETGSVRSAATRKRALYKTHAPFGRLYYDVPSSDRPTTD